MSKWCLEFLLASAVSFKYLAPIFTSIPGIFMVKERVALMQSAFLALASTGILLIQALDQRVPFGYMTLGLGGSFFAGVT